MHLNRTGDDTSGRIWERTRRMGVNTLAFRLPQHNTFYHIDADCVGIFGMIHGRKIVSGQTFLQRAVHHCLYPQNLEF